MAHRRFRGRGISESQRRKKLWSVFNATAQSAGSVGTELTIILNYVSGAGPVVGGVAQQFAAFVFPTGFGAGEIPPESTLLRIRGSVELNKNTVGALDIEANAFGIGVMESGAADQAAFPNPASPTGADWDGWMFYRSQQQGALDANAGIVDVKAMRKIQSGYSLVMVMGRYIVTDDGTPPLAGADLQGHFSGRGLFLLP